MNYYYKKSEENHYIMIVFVGFLRPTISEYFRNYLVYAHPEANNMFTFIFKDEDGNKFLLQQDGTIQEFNPIQFPEEGWVELEWQQPL